MLGSTWLKCASPALATALIAANGFAAPAGYVASFEGEVILSPAAGGKRTLQASDLDRSLRIYAGDKLALTKKESKASLVVYGRRMRLEGITNYTVPASDPRAGQVASRAAMAGRGAGEGDPAPYETLAIFTYQNLGPTPVGNLIPSPDGTLPIVWVVADGIKKVRLKLEIDGMEPVSTDWVDARSNAIEGFPFGSIASKPFGDYLLKHASPDLALEATLVIESDNDKRNTTYWEVPKKAFLTSAVEASAKFDLETFEGFDEAVGFSEGLVGEAAAGPAYPMMRANLVFTRWSAKPSQWLRLSMLHLLALEYRFDGLEAKLKKMLDERDGDGIPTSLLPR